MAKRVFELARELSVRSKDVLTKCRAEGLELKNHMATLSAGLEATIHEWFSEVDDVAVEHTAVETTEHVDLAEVREVARKTRRRRKAKEESEVGVEAEPVPDEGQAPAEAVAALRAAVG